MRVNENTVLIGEKVVLVPYRKEHVPLYHSWMQDPWLREMTASEPLTLEEEYENQQSWHLDEQKCTFIILDKRLADTPGTGSHGGGMAGDINLFLYPEGAEISVMIANPDSRRRGLAKEAVKLMMAYAVQNLQVTSFIARIGDNNEASVRLFRDVLGFEMESHSDYFHETTYRKTVTEDFKAQLLQETSYCVYGTYD